MKTAGALLLAICIQYGALGQSQDQLQRIACPTTADYPAVIDRAESGSKPFIPRRYFFQHGTFFWVADSDHYTVTAASEPCGSYLCVLTLVYNRSGQVITFDPDKATVFDMVRKAPSKKFTAEKIGSRLRRNASLRELLVGFLGGLASTRQSVSYTSGTATVSGDSGTQYYATYSGSATSTIYDPSAVESATRAAAAIDRDATDHSRLYSRLELKRETIGAGQCALGYLYFSKPKTADIRGQNDSAIHQFHVAFDLTIGDDRFVMFFPYEVEEALGVKFH